MLRTPDGHGRIELAMFHTPKAISAEPKDAPANTLGIRRITFAVDDIEDVVALLRAHGAELVGELVQYEASYRLCYVRGPEGIIVVVDGFLDVRSTHGRGQGSVRCVEGRGRFAPTGVRAFGFEHSLKWSRSHQT
jgi:hypothetical protein